MNLVDNEDAGVFLNTEDFGTTATRTRDGRSATVIVDQPHARSEAIEGETITIHVPVVDFGDTIDGDEFEIGGTYYVAPKGPEPEMTSRFAKQKLTARGPKTIRFGQGLATTWIDEYYPTWPTDPFPPPPTEGYPPYYTLETLFVRKTWQAVAQRPVFQLGPFGTLPAGVVITAASLQVFADEADGGNLDWTTHKIRRADMVIEETNWTEYADGQTWTSPGCSDPDDDVDLSRTYAAGAGWKKGWNVIASGDDFVADLNAGVPLGIVLFASDDNMRPGDGTMSADSELEANGKTRARLIVSYRKA